MADIQEMLKDGGRYRIFHKLVVRCVYSIYICCIMLLFLFGTGLVACAQIDCSHKGLGNEDMNRAEDMKSCIQEQAW